MAPSHLCFFNFRWNGPSEHHSIQAFSHHDCTKERAKILWSDVVAQVQSIFQSAMIIHCCNQRL